MTRIPRQVRHRTTGTGRNLVGFVVGDIEYAVDIQRVREIIRPLPLVALPQAPSGVAGVADHRGQVIPVLDLRVRFGLAPEVGRRRAKWILVTSGDRLVGLWVDAVTGVLGARPDEEREVPDLGPSEVARGIRGVCATGGGLVFVLDVDRVTRVADSLDPPGPALGVGQ